MLARNLYLLCSYVRRGNTMRFARILLPVVASVLLLSPAWGQSTQDRVSVRDDIVIERGETVADAVCIGCSIRIEGAVMGDAVSIGGRITVPGRVGGDVVAVGGSIDLTGVVDGDVVAVAGFVELGPGAAVGGDAVGVLGGVEGVRDGRVAGKVTSVRSIVPIVASGFVVLLAICLVAALIIQPLLTLLCAIVLGPQRLEVLARTAASRGLMSFIVGVGLLFASFLLGVFGVFIPFWVPGIQLPIGLIWFVLLVVGYAGISYWVGRGMLPRANPVLAAFLGAVLVTILQMIPVLGWIVGFIFSIIALGIPVTSGFGTAVDWLGGPSKNSTVT